ncbi:MAG: hypothetical protein DME49_00600 [Verrucomicrobia bacterium]|nr:MAG: hypothetical protein DME49_00600 [Verrucomicrobiota bacterium]PYK93384.1 MAG: hypothetical protein DME36_09640 [Verrucomicrobiota bacterium]
MSTRVAALLWVLVVGLALAEDNPLEPSARVMRQFGMSYKQAVRGRARRRSMAWSCCFGSAFSGS